MPWNIQLKLVGQSQRDLSADMRIIALFGSRVIFGAERANIDALRALQDKGAEVQCLTRHEKWGDINDIRSFLGQAGLSHSDAVYVDYPTRGYYLRIALSLPWRTITANFKLYQACKRMNATHIHTYNVFFTMCVLPALYLLRLPIIFRAGDAPTLHNAFFRLGWKLVSRRVSHFVADTEYIKRLLVSAGVNENHVTVIYAPPPTRYCDSREATLPPATSGMVFAYVGRITAHKGVPELLDAFRMVLRVAPNSRLWLAGPTSLPEAVAIKDRVHAEIQAGTVVFLGSVENIPAVLARSDVHVAPSMRPEAYGLVVVEAKAASKPSIIFKGGGMSELVEHEKNGLALNEHTAQALSVAMLTYCNSPGLAAKHGKAAFKSLAALELSTFAERWIGIYNKSLMARF